MSSSRALCGAAVALVLYGIPALGTEPRASDLRKPDPPAAAESTEDLREDVAALRDDIGALWHQLDRLTHGAEAPPWADAESQRLDRRVERLTTMLERLSARIDTPVPRLDEPLTLLTVSLCAAVLGFLAGRSLQRRNMRKDSRFRL